MITAKQLEEHDWTQDPSNKNSWFYDGWEYEFRVVSQELYYINDGMGEPQFISKLTDMESLINAYWSLEHINLDFEAMKKVK